MINNQISERKLVQLDGYDNPVRPILVYPNNQLESSMMDVSRPSFIRARPVNKRSLYLIGSLVDKLGLGPVDTQKIWRSHPSLIKNYKEESKLC